MNEAEVKTAVLNQVTPRHLYEVAILLALALIGSAYINSSNNDARFKQVSQDVAPIHAQAQQEISNATKAESTNQADLVKALAVIAAQKQQPIQTQVDYDRIQQMIESRIGGHASIQSTPGLPDAPSATVNAVKLRDFVSDCDGATAELKSCKVSVSDVTTLLNAEKTDHAATKQELAAAKKAAKGGNFLQRLKHDKNVALGGAAVGVTAVLIVKALVKH